MSGKVHAAGLPADDPHTPLRRGLSAHNAARVKSSPLSARSSSNTRPSPNSKSVVLQPQMEMDQCIAELEFTGDSFDRKQEQLQASQWKLMRNHMASLLAKFGEMRQEFDHLRDHLVEEQLEVAMQKETMRQAKLHKAGAEQIANLGRSVGDSAKARDILNERVSELEQSLRSSRDMQIAAEEENGALSGLVGSLQEKVEALEEQADDQKTNLTSFMCESLDKQATELAQHVTQVDEQTKVLQEKVERVAEQLSESLDKQVIDLELRVRGPLEASMVNALETLLENHKASADAHLAALISDWTRLGPEVLQLRATVAGHTEEFVGVQAQLQNLDGAICESRKLSVQSQQVVADEHMSVDDRLRSLEMSTESWDAIQEQLQNLHNTVAGCPQDSSLSNLNLQEVEERLRSKLSSDKEFLMSKFSELASETATKEEIEEVHVRVNQMRSMVSEEQEVCNHAVKCMQGELLAALRSEKSAREKIEEHVTQRLEDVEVFGMKQSELGDFTADTKKRFQQLQDEQKRARDTLESSVHELLRKEHSAHQFQMQEQWDREQKTRELHNEHYNEALCKERAAREDEAKAQNVKMDQMEQSLSKLDSVEAIEINMRQDRIQLSAMSSKIDLIENDMLQERKRLWSAIRTSTSLHLPPDEAEAADVTIPLPPSAAKEEGADTRSARLNQLVSVSARLRATSPSVLKVRCSSPPLRTSELLLRDDRVVRELPSVSAPSDSFRAGPARSVSIPMFSVSSLGAHTPSTMFGTTPGASHSSLPGSSSVESETQPGMLIASKDQTISYVTRSLSTGTRYSSLTRTSSGLEVITSPRIAPSTPRKSSPSPAPSGVHIVNRARSCTLPVPDKAGKLSTKFVAHTDPAEFPPSSISYSST